MWRLFSKIIGISPRKAGQGIQSEASENEGPHSRLLIRITLFDASPSAPSYHRRMQWCCSIVTPFMTEERRDDIVREALSSTSYKYEIWEPTAKAALLRLKETAVKEMVAEEMVAEGTVKEDKLSFAYEELRKCFVLSRGFREILPKVCSAEDGWPASISSSSV